MLNAFGELDTFNDSEITLQTVVRQLFFIGKNGTKEDAPRVGALKALADILQKGNPLDPEKDIDEQIRELGEIITLPHLLGVLPRFEKQFDLIIQNIEQIKEGKKK